MKADKFIVEIHIKSGLKKKTRRKNQNVKIFNITLYSKVNNQRLII